MSARSSEQSMDDDVRKDELPPPAPPIQDAEQVSSPLWLSVCWRGVAEIRHPMGWSTWKNRSQRSSLAEDPATAERFTPTPTERERAPKSTHLFTHTHTHTLTSSCFSALRDGFIEAR
uniref:(northern house mosquito) hypothetical protein n=1 Tax=Culex pipiens TaxID=7175 RepID=A0A8D8CF72_CULPI